MRNKKEILEQENHKCRTEWKNQLTFTDQSLLATSSKIFVNADFASSRLILSYISEVCKKSTSSGFDSSGRPMHNIIRNRAMKKREWW